MKHEIREIDPCKRELDVDAPAEVWQEALDRAARALARKIRLPGFRPGKVPAPMAKKMFRNELETDVLEKLIPDITTEIFEEKEIAPLARPRLQDKHLPSGSNDTFRFTVAFEVQPEVKLTGVKGLELIDEPIEVTDEEVANALERIRAGRAELEPIEEAEAAAGDMVVAIFDYGHGARSPAKPVTIREGDEATELDKALVSCKAGDKLAVTLSPETPPLPAEPAHRLKKKGGEPRPRPVTILVQSVKRRVLPDLDDDLARDVGAFETLDELKGQVREDLETQAKKDRRVKLVRKALDAITEANEVPVPETLVEQQTAGMLEEFARETGIRSLRDRPDLETKLVEQFRPDAEKTVLLGLVLDTVAKDEGIDAPQEQVEERIREMAAATNRSPEAVRARLDKEGRLKGIAEAIKHERTIDFILEHATVTNEEP